MSRRLIIQSADFSTNGIMNVDGVEYVDLLGLNAANFTRESTATQNYYFPSPSYQCPLVAGKSILGIRVKTVGAGNFDLLQMVGYSSDPSGKNSGTITVLGTYSGSSGKVKTIIFDTPIVVPDDGNVCFGIRPTGTKLYFYDSLPPSLYYLTATNGTWNATSNFGGGFELLVNANE